MTLEENLRTNVLAYSAVTALIGQRMYQTRILQNTAFPCVAYQRISTDRRYTMNQIGNARWGSAGWARFQFTAFSNDGANGGIIAAQVCDSIRASLATFNLAAESGNPFSGAPNFVISERAGDIPDTMPPVYTQMLDVRVFFRDQ